LKNFSFGKAGVVLLDRIGRRKPSSPILLNDSSKTYFLHTMLTERPKTNHGANKTFTATANKN
jgi:hypothetical protein